uniref:Uncharacterized protein n=2 Tax=Heterosigma akashiwo TaxID=2829 RepID=A0A7S3USH0_HETAK
MTSLAKAISEALSGQVKNEEATKPLGESSSSRRNQTTSGSVLTDNNKVALPTNPHTAAAAMNNKLCNDENHNPASSTSVTNIMAAPRLHDEEDEYAATNMDTFMTLNF